MDCEEDRMWLARIGKNWWGKLWGESLGIWGRIRVNDWWGKHRNNWMGKAGVLKNSGRNQKNMEKRKGFRETISVKFCRYFILGRPQKVGRWWGVLCWIIWGSWKTNNFGGPCGLKKKVCSNFTPSWHLTNLSSRHYYHHHDDAFRYSSRPSTIIIFILSSSPLYHLAFFINFRRSWWHSSRQLDTSTSTPVSRYFPFGTSPSSGFQCDVSTSCASKGFSLPTNENAYSLHRGQPRLHLQPAIVSLNGSNRGSDVAWT